MTPEENHHPRNATFLAGVLVAVAGGSFVVGMHDMDSFLVLAPPFIVLAYLTLTAAALLAAVLAAAGARRAATVTTVLLFVAYALVAAAAWYRFATDPGMFEEDDSESSAVLKSARPL